MAPYGTGATRFARRMTDAEALMWNVEKDPWLSSTIGTVLITDRPVDHDAFRRKVAAAVAAIPRLRERVVPRLGRLTPTSATWRCPRPATGASCSTCAANCSPTPSTGPGPCGSSWSSTAWPRAVPCWSSCTTP